MHSSFSEPPSEPFDHRSAIDPSLPAPTPAPSNEAWRDEVASRVHSYRARRNSKAEQASLALDFEAAPDGAPIRGAKASAGTASAGAAVARTAIAEEARAGTQYRENASHPPARRDAPAAHSAFDTNYYRRLNAQALEQSFRGAAAATAAAVARLPQPERAEPEWAEPQRQAGAEAESAALPQAPGKEVEGGLAIDLALHAPAAGDACLERYRIQGAETEADWREAPAAQVPLPASPDLSRTDAARTELARTDLARVEAARVDPAPAEAPAPAAQGNLIVFPRPLLEPPLLPQPSRDELAEPVHARPRILEVPEDIMPAMQASLFPEIRLDAEEPEISSREPEIEISLPVAPLSARLTAGLADAAVVLAAGGLFAAIADRAMPGLPHGKTYWMVLGAVTVLLWALYQHLFLLYAGRTAGMQMNGIRLSTFDGRTPEWSERRRRARFIVVSLVSVALGFLWALVDEETLCWHDRVSQTFPTMD